MNVNTARAAIAKKHWRIYLIALPLLLSVRFIFNTFVINAVIYLPFIIVPHPHRHPLARLDTERFAFFLKKKCIINIFHLLFKRGTLSNMKCDECQSRIEHNIYYCSQCGYANCYGCWSKWTKRVIPSIKINK